MTKIGLWNHLRLLWWERLETVEQQKMGIFKHFRPLVGKRLGKVVESFGTTLVGNDWKKYRSLYICYKNVKNRVCQKLSLHIYYL